jgi:hypothetical protein
MAHQWKNKETHRAKTIQLSQMPYILGWFDLVAGHRHFHRTNDSVCLLAFVYDYGVFRDYVFDVGYYEIHT